MVKTLEGDRYALCEKLFLFPFCCSHQMHRYLAGCFGLISGRHCLDYSEWDYEYQKGQHVKIDLAQYYIEDKVGNRGYQLKVCYKYFTDEELNTAIQEKKEENAIENANLLNDI